MAPPLPCSVPALRHTCVALCASHQGLKDEGSTVFDKYTVKMHAFSPTGVDLKRSAPGKGASEAGGMDPSLGLSPGSETNELHHLGH